MIRFAVLIGCVVSGFACKDPPSSSPAPARGSSTTSKGVAPSLPDEKPEAPHPHAGQDERSIELDGQIAGEPEDASWAGPTARALRALVPGAKEVTCRTRTCRIVVVSATEKEIFAVVETLRPQADQVIAPSPQDQDGRLLARLYLVYER
jgi:hypothetical protein